MKINEKDIKRILLITLSNVGDIILTTPLVSVLKSRFPDARLDVMVGPLGREIFINNPRISSVITYNKYTPLRDKRELIRELRKARYDLIVDLKNTLIPILAGSRYRTSPIRRPPNGVSHKKEFHLWKLKSLGIETGNAPFSIYISEGDREYINNLLEKIPGGKDGFVAVSPASKSLIKRWSEERFALLCDRLREELKTSLVMIGGRNDKGLIERITALMKFRPYNLAGMTTIPQLACLLEKSRLLITNDSAPMHVASALGAKVLAIFGPTDPDKYGPLGEDSIVVRKKLPCSPCEAAQCRFKHECMESISADEVYETAKRMVEAKSVKRKAQN